jgi:spore photoproduct lyase
LDNRLLRQFERVYLNEASKESSVGQRVLQLFSGEKIEVVNDSPFPTLEAPLSAENYELSRRQLYVTPFKGQFFKRCPGAKPGVACCNYYVLNLGIQCNFDCSYCFLHGYANIPAVTVYSNIEDALEQLRAAKREFGDFPFRVGTGEMTDSLSLDPITHYSQSLVSFFREFPSWTLELKTKSTYIDKLLETEHAGNVVVAWSVNTQTICDREERLAAPIHKRLNAAEEARDAGYKIAFHFDPVFWYPDWKADYEELIDEIANRFSPLDVYHVSLGALRFSPEQYTLLKERFGMNSLTTQAELFKSRDGKLRYDQSLRTKMFQTLIERFKLHDSRWKIALCMEQPESWLNTVESTPIRVPEIRDLFLPGPKCQKNL